MNETVVDDLTHSKFFTKALNENLMMTNEEYHEVDKKKYLPTFKRFPIAFSQGKGSRLWDVEGKEYIDMLAGIAVNNVGHCHPHVVRAIQKQAAELMHISNFFVSPSQVALSEKLTQLSGLENIFLCNSGAEAVEGAIKIARKHASKNGRGGTVISMENSFHGRTLATIATGKKKYQEGFSPIPAGFISVPFNNIQALKEKIADDVAAIIIEPIQGEGGINIADLEYLKALRNLCDEHNILLIFDEVQSGIGRTGQWFAKDHFGVQPDIMALAKGLGGGMPIGAFLCNSKVSAAIDFGDHGTTFGGNPLASAASLATIEVIEKENLCENARTLGAWLIQELSNLKRSYSCIKDVRGLGLMIGLELDIPAASVIKDLLEKGVVANVTADTVIRFVPPLNISKEDLKKVLELTAESLKKLEAEHVR